MKRLAVLLVVALVGAAAYAVTATGATSPTIHLRSTGKLGKIIVDSKGRTLYLFEKDKHGKSACSGQCAKFWPPLIVTHKPTAGKGLSKSKLGTTRRSDGKLQATYGGWPLYRFVMDKNKPGSTKGEDLSAFGAKWYVEGANGKKIEPPGGS